MSEKPFPETPGASSSEEMPAQLQQLLATAVDSGATDIHVDPMETQYKIRFRVDGAIQPHATLDAAEGEQLVNQLKVSTGFSPDRATTAQEGRIDWYGGNNEREEIRVTILPTVQTEAIHLRLLGPPSEILQPEELGLSEGSMALVHRNLTAIEGLILVSGHTGSGKTMTLYSLVSMLDRSAKQVCSIEDPVEYQLDGVRQVQVDPEHNLHMHNGLRTLLRMDPDVLVVGEIRDAQSATTAVRAAASGCLVLATVHARDVALAVEMLKYYNVSSKLLGNTLRLIISQDLVRKLCPECCEKRATTDEEKDLFKEVGLNAPDELAAPGNGCEHCHGYAYRGRKGVFEVVHVEEELGRSISADTKGRALRQLAREKSARTLKRGVLENVASGTTSMAEAVAVLELGASGQMQS